MAKTTLALIVAGTGDTTAKEVFDLCEDSTAGYDEIDLIIPIDKTLFTEAVEHAVEWYDDDKHVVAVQTEGSSLSRKSSRLGSGAEVVPIFAAVFEDKFEGFDKVEFYIALPDPEADDFDQHVEWVEAAIAAGVPVKNLCAGLDDVVLEEEPETEAVPDPEPEKEAEPEKPARRSRSRKAAEPEPVAEEETAPEPEEEAPAPLPDAPEVDKSALADALGAYADVVAYLEQQEKAYRLFMLDTDSPDRPIVVAARKSFNTIAEAVSPHLAGSEPVNGSTSTEKAEKPAAGSSGGRGRPRTNFEVKQIWDEATESWIARPKGRMAKGTEWRVIHAETDEVLDEGTA